MMLDPWTNSVDHAMHLVGACHNFFPIIFVNIADVTIRKNDIHHRLMRLESGRENIATVDFWRFCDTRTYY